MKLANIQIGAVFSAFLFGLGLVSAAASLQITQACLDDVEMGAPVWAKFYFGRLVPVFFGVLVIGMVSFALYIAHRKKLDYITLLMSVLSLLLMCVDVILWRVYTSSWQYPLP